jgi:hypothetical protein
MNRKLLAAYIGTICVVAVAFLGRWALTENLCLRGPHGRSLPREALSPGDTVRLRAGGLDILAECDLAPPPSVSWGSSDSTVLRVSPEGVITAVDVGTATIIARARFVHASHRLMVVRD